MSQEDVKNKASEQAAEESSVQDTTNKENEGCCCNLFSYKRPTEDDAKKTKRKTCC